MADTPPTLSAAGSRPQKTTGKTKLKKTTTPAKPKATPKATGVPTGGDRLAQWLANPGLRSKLPDSALTPDLLQTRQTNAYNSAPAAPGSSYSNSDLAKLVQSLTQTKYGAAETALKQQGTALDARQNTQIPAWFQAYRDQVAGARQQEQAGAAAQVGSLQQMAATAAGDTGALAGAPMDAAGAARAQAAAQIRSAGIGNQAALAQNLGGNQDTFLQNLGLLSNGQQQSALLNVGQQKNDLASQIAQLALDKGNYQTTQRSQILSDESDSALKNALTQAQIGTQTATAANTAATTKKTQTETTKSESDQAYFDKHGYYPGTGKPAAKSPDVITSGAFAGYTKTQVAKMSPDKKNQLKSDYAKNGGKGASDKDEFGNTTKQRAASNDALDKALVYARQAVKDKKHGPGLAGDWKALANALVVGFGVNTKYATAAAQQVVLGHVGPNTSKELKRRGVKLPKRTKTAVAKTVDQAVADTGTVISGLPGVSG